MELRPELMPPALDEAKVARLVELAAALDGARPGQWEGDFAEFNRLAGAAIPIEEFQGIYGGEDYEDWVRRVLYHEWHQTCRPCHESGTGRVGPPGNARERVL